MNKKDYKGYELIKVIHDGEIKDGTIIEVHDLSTLDHINAKIKYLNKRLNWITGEFDTSCLFDDNIYFRALEDNTEEIEELDNWFVDERKECREFDIQAINLCFSKHRDKINELIKAVNSIRKDKNND